MCCGLIRGKYIVFLIKIRHNEKGNTECRTYPGDFERGISSMSLFESFQEEEDSEPEVLYFIK